MEQRQQTRYGLHALVDFEWIDREGVLHQGHGLTRDISLRGMFIYSKAEPPLKTDVQVEVSFRSIAEAATNLRIRARALVIRVETATESEASRGFAILNRSYRLHDDVAPIDD